MEYILNLSQQKNMFCIITGNYSLNVAASPLLNNVIYESTKKVTATIF